MKKFSLGLLVILTLAAPLALGAAPADAATPMTTTRAGTYYLTRDLQRKPGHGSTRTGVADPGQRVLVHP